MGFHRCKSQKALREPSAGIPLVPHSPRETQKRRNPKSQEAESRRGDARSRRAAALGGAPPSHPCPASRTLGSVSIQDDNWRKSSFPAKNEYFPSQTPTSRETCSLGALHRFPSCPACHAHGPVPAGQSGDPAAQGFAPKGLHGGNPLKIRTEVRAGKAAGFLEFLLQKAFCGICHSPESPPQWKPAPAERSHPTSPALTQVGCPHVSLCRRTQGCSSRSAHSPRWRGQGGGCAKGDPVAAGPGNICARVHGRGSERRAALGCQPPRSQKRKLWKMARESRTRSK